MFACAQQIFFQNKLLHFGVARYPKFADVSWEALFEKRRNILLNTTFSVRTKRGKDARLSDLSRSQTQSPSSNHEGLHRCQNVSRAMRTAGRIRHCGLQIRK